MKSVALKAFALLLLLAVSVSAYTGDRSDDPLGVAVSPQTLILGLNQGGKVTVHSDIPYGDVDLGSLYLNGVPVRSTKPDDCGNLVAFFDEAKVKATVQVGVAKMTFVGYTVDNEYFEGYDTVKVIRR